MTRSSPSLGHATQSRLIDALLRRLAQNVARIARWPRGRRNYGFSPGVEPDGPTAVQALARHEHQWPLVQLFNVLYNNLVRLGGLAFCWLSRCTAAAVPGGNAAIELIQPSR